MKSYEIIIERDCAGALGALPQRQYADVVERLGRAAEEAAGPRRLRVGPEHVAGVNRGLHRALAGKQWIVFRVDHARQSVSLVKFVERQPALLRPA